MSLIVLNGFDSGLLRMPSRGKGTVADLKLDHVLALGLQRLGDRQDVKGRFRP